MNHGHPSEEKFAEYLADKLSPAEKAVIDGHCIDCEECRRRLAAMIRSLGAGADDDLEDIF